jgi:hypothetical protein
MTNGYTKILRFSEKPFHAGMDLEKEEVKGEDGVKPSNRIIIATKSIGVSLICRSY